MQIIRVLAVAATMTSPAATLAAQVVSKTTVSNVEYRGLSIVSERVAWASGTRGTVARTTDGGDTWRADTVPSASMLDFRAIHAIDDTTAIVASAGEAEKGLAKIFRTTDGGRTWKMVFYTDLPGVFFDAMAFRDERHGVALSDPLNGRFFMPTTRDGGASWQVDSIRGPETIPGEAAFAASGGNVVAIGPTLWIGTGGGGRSRVHRSGDGGRTWTAADVPIHSEGNAAGIFAIAFSDPIWGVAVGGDYTKVRLATTSVALTLNGGRTWRPATSPPAAYLSSVAYVGGIDRLVATGLAGTFVSVDRGDTWQQVDSVAMNTVRFKGKIGFLVGPRGRIERWKR